MPCPSACTIPMETIPETLRLALQHHQAGRLQEAEALYRQILQSQPDHPDALHLLGLLAHQSGRHETAVELIGKAIAINPAVAEFHNNLGEACRALGRFEDAKASYHRALALKAGLVEARYNLGNVLVAAGKIEEAAAHYRQSLPLTPAYVEAIVQPGTVRKQQGKPDEQIHGILSRFLSGVKVPVFDRIDLSYYEQAYVRGKPRQYLECACDLLRFLAERSSRPVSSLVIVEVGSMYSSMPHPIEEFEPRCCNAGHSTAFWSRTGAAVHTVDLNTACRTALLSLCREYPNLVVHTQDGIRFLKEFRQPIDLLYLDAWDVLPGMPYAEMHAEAYEAARPRLAASCIVSIDDTDMGSGGKGRLVVPGLLLDGFEIVAHGRQTIAVRLGPK